MLKVLIVDDEFWVCELLRGIIDWENEGFCIISEAHDGYEALRLSEQKKPDLILTDIRMAGIDGIEFLEKLYESGNHARVIVISGYSDFELAQSAMKYGAMGYLLKPVEKEDLLYYLKKVREYCQTQREEHADKELLNEQLSYSRQRLKEEYFLQVYQTRFREPLRSADELNEHYSCHFQDGLFRIVLYQIDRKTPDTLSPEHLLSSLKAELISWYHPYCSENIVVAGDQTLMQVLCYLPEKKDTIYTMLRNSIHRIREKQLLSIRYEMTVGLGVEVYDFRKLPHSFETASCAVDSRIRNGIGKVIEAEGDVLQRIGQYDSLFTGEKMLFEKLLAGRDYDGAGRLIQQVFTQLKEDRSIPAVMVFQTGEAFLLICQTEIRKDPSDHSALQEKVDEQLSTLRNIFQIDQIQEKLISFIREWKEYNANLFNHRNEQIIRIARRFIAEHYQEDITLQIVADKVSMNPRYLSEVFKKVTGTGYNEYLTEFRLDMAKELLKDARIKAKDVGEMVGYHDPKYFSKLFKKNTGISLAQYRKLFS